MTLPRFVVAGVPKAGTTSLYHYLAAQSGVYVSDVKEINFLSYPGAEEALQRYPWLRFPVTSVEQYEALFAPAADRVPIDFSPSCFRSHVAVDRIRQFVPAAGILLVLRDPVGRAWSAYQHRIRKGYERRGPEDALVAGDRVVDMGFYADRVEELRRAFGAERVGVWLFDDLSADPVATVGSILRHVGATPAEPAKIDGRAHNAARLPRSQFLHRLFPDHARRRAILERVPRGALRPLEWVWRANQRAGDAIPEATEARLRALYAEDVARLQAILQRDLTGWLPGARV
ncbi:MAG TPA: sulfotransferase [Acidimicrobiales bacterium]|nr:sulfotransferase [Acidimicrobiales bacterium]